MSVFIVDQVLEFFGISIPSFQVGGGILLMLIAISMLQGRTSHLRQTPEEAQEASDREAIAVVPLSIPLRSEEHTSELQSLMRISYAVFCLKKKKTHKRTKHRYNNK